VEVATAVHEVPLGDSAVPSVSSTRPRKEQASVGKINKITNSVATLAKARFPANPQAFKSTLQRRHIAAQVAPWTGLIRARRSPACPACGVPGAPPK